MLAVSSTASSADTPQVSALAQALVMLQSRVSPQISSSVMQGNSQAAVLATADAWELKSASIHAFAG